MTQLTEREWPMWEVFIRSQHGLAHKHVGSLHAANSSSALQHARDVYTRRVLWRAPAERRSVVAELRSPLLECRLQLVVGKGLVGWIGSRSRRSGGSVGRSRASFRGGLRTWTLSMLGLPLLEASVEVLRTLDIDIQLFPLNQRVRLDTAAAIDNREVRLAPPPFRRIRLPPAGRTSHGPQRRTPQ